MHSVDYLLFYYDIVVDKYININAVKKYTFFLVKLRYWIKFDIWEPYPYYIFRDMLFSILPYWFWIKSDKFCIAYAKRRQTWPYNRNI